MSFLELNFVVSKQGCGVYSLVSLCDHRRGLGAGSILPTPLLSVDPIDQLLPFVGHVVARLLRPLLQLQGQHVLVRRCQLADSLDAAQSALNLVLLRDLAGVGPARSSARPQQLRLSALRQFACCLLNLTESVEVL